MLTSRPLWCIASLVFLFRFSSANCPTSPFCDAYPECSRSCLGGDEPGNNISFSHSFDLDWTIICSTGENLGGHYGSIFKCIDKQCPSSADGQAAWNQLVDDCASKGFTLDSLLKPATVSDHGKPHAHCTGSGTYSYPACLSYYSVPKSVATISTSSTPSSTTPPRPTTTALSTSSTSTSSTTGSTTSPRPTTTTAISTSSIPLSETLSTSSSTSSGSPRTTPTTSSNNSNGLSTAATIGITVGTFFLTVLSCMLACAVAICVGWLKPYQFLWFITGGRRGQRHKRRNEEASQAPPRSLLPQ